MPIHDWSRVDAGIFHDFHHAWIEELKRSLNSGLLPPEFYALAEQHAAGFGPDVLTLQTEAPEPRHEEATPTAPDTGVSLMVSPPKVRITAEADLDFYRRRQNRVVVRHASGDRVIAVVEVVSPGNKSSRRGMRSLVEKVAELLDRGIHLLILDVHAVTDRDPQGIHGAIWEEITGQSYSPPSDKDRTLAAYEANVTVRAYVEPLALGDALTNMPLFLEPGAHVEVPLESTYASAFQAVPVRWRSVLETAS